MPLSSSLEARSAGPRTLFVVGAMVTTAILLWMHQWRLGNDRHGLSTIFFVLFVDNDYPGTVCALLILVAALIGSRYLPGRRVVQWVGDHPLVIAAITAHVEARSCSAFNARHCAGEKQMVRSRIAISQRR